MKKALAFLVLVGGLIGGMGCATSRSLNGFQGGSGGGGSANFEAGNWAFTANGHSGQISLGGYLSATGSSVTGNLFVAGSQTTGFLLTPSSAPMAVSGTLSGGTLTLTGAISSSNFTITFTGLSNSGTITSLSSGSFTVTGGTDNGDSGTISGVIAGSYTGTWAGTDGTTGGTMTVAMTEATTPNANGSFTLTPTSGSGVSFSGAVGCTVTGLLNPSAGTNSYVAGNIVFLNIATVDNTVAGQLQFVGFANNPASPTALTGGGYYYSGGSGCMLQNTNTEISFALTKQ